MILDREIRIFRVPLPHGATCRTNTFERADSRVLPTLDRKTIGSIANSPSVISRMSDCESGSACCSSSCLTVPERVFRWRNVRKLELAKKITPRRVRRTARYLRDEIDNRFVPFSNTEPVSIQSNCCLGPDGFAPHDSAPYIRARRGEAWARRSV